MPKHQSISVGLSKGGIRLYNQRYRAQWENLPECQGWLRKHPSSELMAFCLVCKKGLLSRKKNILNHASTKIHKKNLDKSGIMKSIEYVMNSEEEFLQIDDDNIIGDDDHDEDEKTIKGIYVEETDAKSLFMKETETVSLKFSKLTLDTTQNKPLYLQFEHKGRKFKVSLEKSSSQTAFNNKERQFKYEHKECDRWCCSYPDVPPVYEDKFLIFGKFVASEIRNISDDYEKQKIKIKINTVLFRAFTGFYNCPQYEKLYNESSEIPKPQLVDLEEDQWTNFGKYIANELSSITSKSAQIIAKQQICRIIYESVTGVRSNYSLPPSPLSSTNN